jgi:hypothetical protein
MNPYVIDFVRAIAFLSAIMNTISITFTVLSNVVYKINNKEPYLPKEFGWAFVSLTIFWMFALATIFYLHKT